MKEDNNELENLYNKAASEFPLNTEGSNWHYVLNKLEEKEKQPLFWLLNRRLLVASIFLLVVASGFFINKYVQNKNEIANKNNDQVIAQQLIDKEKLTEEITNTVYKKIIDSIENIEKRKQNNISINNQTNSYEKQTLKIITNNQQSFKATNIEKFKTNGTITTTNNVTKKQIIKPKLIDDNSLDAKKQSIASINKTESLNAAIARNYKPETIEPKIEQIKTAQASKSTILKEPKKSKFYVGILASGEISSLGFKSEKRDADEPFDFGLAVIAGINLSKKISIETGLILRQKEYYTSSSSFNKSILPLKGNMIGIESESKLIEIPLTVNLNLLNTKKHNLFASFGESSYIVNDEHYEYEEEVNGIVTKEVTLFTQTSSNFLATCNFGLGYQFKLNAKTNLRVQPYINLPLSGMGKGNEPIVSKGVFVGLTQNF